ncbi:hypothetical protein GOV06_02115 [Candidatus Woesearchaeota archaeon]|nr:hypothetical protein [Candidatus Woesearchaeota archaeon]
MGYDQDFYTAYKSYLAEPTVRKAHDAIFRIASLDPDFNDVIDFGCGAFNEFFVHSKPERYMGIDANAASQDINADYRNTENLAELIQPETPTAFVSLFSTEITARFEDNYLLYEKIFDEIPTICSGLVSGFYYASKKDQNPIGETGGIQSYQTLEDIEDVCSDTFEERRIILPVPSLMFGKDVFEIWKFFEKK